jgi:multiple sugar transport system substrate-binding protein
VAATPAEPEQVTLRFTIVAGEDEMPGWEGITNAWNEDSDEVFVELERLPGGWDEYIQKMTAQIAAGDPPDIGRMGCPWVPAFVANGHVLDLGQLAERDAFPYDDYYEASFDLYRIGSSLWGMPIGIYTMANWVNKTLFEEAGVELPALDWNSTWDWSEFREAANMLTSGEGAEKTFGLFINFHPERSLQYIYQNGGSFLSADKTRCTINEPPAVEALQFLQDIMWEDLAAPQPAQVQTLPLTDMFQTGRLGMYQEGQWMTGYMRTITDFEWGVTPFPQEVSAATEAYVDGYIVYKGAEEHINEAWQVIKSFVGEKAENILVDTALAGIPVLKQVAEARTADMFNPLPPEEKQVWIDSVSVARTPPFTENWRELTEAAMEELDLVGLNEKSAAEACDAIAEKVDALLA